MKAVIQVLLTIKNRLQSQRINRHRKLDTSVDAASHLYFYHDCIHPAQVENKGLDMVRIFFFFHRQQVCFFQDTTEDPMVLKAHMSVSVCDIGLHFTENTHRVFSFPIKTPETTLNKSVNLWTICNNLGHNSHGQSAAKTMYITLSLKGRRSHVNWHLSTLEHEETAVYHKAI